MLEQMMPDAWRVFFRHRSPRPIQEAAIPVLLRGKSVLLSSPTASGKTEAVLAPLYQRHVTFNRPRLSVIYVAPTKALVNDMYSRLSEYFCEISGDIIQRYTGDHHEFHDPTHKFVLLATPEALDSLQLTRPDLLLHVRAMVCDELHLLHGASRGQQLRHVIARIRSRVVSPSDDRDVFQIVGMTATIHDQAAVARLWLGVGAENVAVGEPRGIDIEVIPAEPTPARAIAATVAQEDCQKLLIFANTRNQAHQLVAELSQQLSDKGWPVYLHIGILARGERERVERAMKYERRGICVATSTLEVGIDIGDVDVIALLQPPISITAFLQRIGRGNRRSERCRVWAIARNEAERQLYRALLRCAETGVLDDVHEYHRHSVEVQQIISLAWVGIRQHSHLTRTNLAERSGGTVSTHVVDDMLGTGILREVGETLVPSDEWMDIGDSRRIHSVISGTGGLPMIDVESGEILGMADRTVTEGILYVGTRFRRAAGADSSGVYVETGPPRHPTPLAKLPASRRGIGGISRQLVWALADLQGINPRQWVRNGAQLHTWGGDQYNLLLCEVLRVSGIAGAFESNATAVEGIADTRAIVPSYVRDIASKAFAEHRIRVTTAIKFRQSTSFLSRLGPELQKEEALASVPMNGFVRWLEECDR